MSGMEEPHDYDPIARSRREAPTFNYSWLKHGETMTLAQRIGFAIFSLVFVAGGLTSLSLALLDLRNADFVGALGWSLPTLFFLVPGILGLRNVLRF